MQRRKRGSAAIPIPGLPGNITMGAKIKSLLFLAAAMTGVLQQAIAQQSTVVRIPHVSAPPKIEDFIHGNRRHEGLRIAEFRQRKPQDGAPSSQGTTAFLSFDDRNFYAVFVCKADPRTLRAHLAKRENIAGDDAV